MIAVAGHGLFERKSLKDENDYSANNEQNACNNSGYTG